MMSDASEMLAAALEQMDGIIAGSKAMDYSNGLFDCQSPTSPFLGGLRVLHLLEDLRAALELMDNEERDNLRCQIPDSTAEGLAEWLHGRMTNVHSAEVVYQERLSRLESDKECLILQVSVLTDQVEVQGEKIRDLDKCLEHHREKLNSTEQLLQQVRPLQSRLVSIVQFSNLRFRQFGNNTKFFENFSPYENSFYSSICSLLRVCVALQELLNRSALETQKLELMTEVSSLKLKLTAVERDHKDNEVDPCPENVLYKIEPRGVEGKLKEASVFLFVFAPDAEMLKMKKVLESLTSENDDKERRIKELEESLIKCKKVQEMVKGQTAKNKAGPGSSTPSKGKNTSEDSFGTKKARSSFGRGFFKLRGGRQAASSPNLDRTRNASAPVLAETERKGTEHLDLAGVPPRKPHDGAALPSSPETKKKSRGLKKFFGRLKRSHSTSFNLDDAADMEFRRGGVRATAGPRLGWSHELKHNGVDVPFSRWSKDDVCVWLHEQGLGLYVAQGQSWIKSGQTLLQASQHDLEKELGMKQPLHRKKLQLALQALGSEEEDLKGKLDHDWVNRWLDDIGLPQYKSHFDEARVDGRMLHYMTVEDLLSLKVGSVLHHLSIKRAIQVLRLNFYEPSCLRRRPSDENNVTPAEISQWTNHRVMEWLRSVDLAEYAPNLRGSGVHGGLMVLEPRFNVEALALLLNIPPNKTLLRRHLATHFHLLIGSEAQRLKQDCLENPDYSVLTATAKVKPRRLSFGGFGTLRKKRHDDGEEYVCPMNVEMPKNSSFQRSVRIYEENFDHLEQMEDSEGTVRQIGAFSEGINNLTSMLKDDEFFREISVCGSSFHKVSFAV
uniref:SAM domain-containing protein n=1 Tax=Amphiprion ocellaris TaxID=80972 RepID=A0AAQ6A261_AMPOC